MTRPSRRFRVNPEAPASTPDDNGPDGIDWDTSTIVPTTPLTVEESDGSPSAFPVDTVKLDAADFTLVDNADGSVSVTTDEPDAAAHIADSSDAHDASAISIVDSGGYYSGTDVEAALQAIGLVLASGTMTNPMTTAGDIIVGGASGTPTRLAAGATSGHVLTSNGSGVAPSWQAPAGGSGGGWPLLATFTASSQATLDCTGFINSTLYDNYEFVIQNLVPATNNVDLFIRVGTGGGPTYQSGGSDYNTALFAHAATGNANSGGTASAIPLRGSATDVSNTASKGGVDGRFTLYNPSSGAIETRLVGTFGYWTSQSVGVETSAQYLATTAVTAIRFLFSSGNIASGKVRIYGIPK